MTKKKNAAPARKKAKTRAKPIRRENGLVSSIELFDIAEKLTAPFARALETLLRLAAEEVGAAGASVLVRDDSTAKSTRGALKFLAATGEVAPKLKKTRVPRGRGVAGFVYESGQPIAVADAAHESAFYPEVDRTTGYSTQVLVATPLRAAWRGDETIGVLEFVNRPGAPPYLPFTPEEMDAAARYAEPVAALVEAHDLSRQLVMLFETDAPKDLSKRLDALRAAPEHRDLLELACALRDIATRGEAERRLCRELLDSLARWTDARSGASF